MNRPTRTRSSRRSWWWWGVCLLFCTAWPVLPAWAGALPSAIPALPLGWLREVVTRYGLWLGLVAAFGAGLTLNLTPCVYPMIPVTLAFFSHQAGGSWTRTMRLACLYVLGISLNYALLGMIAAKTGALFGSWLQHPAVLIGVAVVIVALSLSLFGLYEFRLPHVVTRQFGQASTGLWGAFVMGLVVGVIAAPCIGPVVLGLLLFVGQLANPVSGFLLFFMLGLGMGLPYVVLGIVAQRVGQLPKAGAWLVWVKQALGLVLWGLALYLLRPLLSARLLKVGVTGLLLGAGVYLGWLERTHGSGRAFVWVRRLVGAALVCAAVAPWSSVTLRADATISWSPFSEAALAQARHEQRPVIVDVYADWCIPCVEMDHATFHHPRVVQALASVTTLRVDATNDVPPEAAAFLERFQVYGAPTILFFDRDGRERPDLRLLGFAKPDEFLQRLQDILR